MQIEIFLIFHQQTFFNKHSDICMIKSESKFTNWVKKTSIVILYIEAWKWEDDKFMIYWIQWQVLSCSVHKTVPSWFSVDVSKSLGASLRGNKGKILLSFFFQDLKNLPTTISEDTVFSTWIHLDWLCQSGTSDIATNYRKVCFTVPPEVILLAWVWHHHCEQVLLANLTQSCFLMMG